MADSQRQLLGGQLGCEPEHQHVAVRMTLTWTSPAWNNRSEGRRIKSKHSAKAVS